MKLGNLLLRVATPSQMPIADSHPALDKLPPSRREQVRLPLLDRI